MAERLICSKSPLFLDTLPALKVRFSSGGEAVYTLARFYMLGGDFYAGLFAFEREPAAGSAVSLALAGPGGHGLMLTLTPEAAFYRPFGPQAPLLLDAAQNGQALDAERFAGEDEQGWYWGARLVLDETALAKAGLVPAREWGIALFKHTLGKGPFAASCPVGTQDTPPGPEHFTAFTF